MGTFVCYFQTFPVFSFICFDIGGMDMIMGWVFCILIGTSCVCSLFTGQGSALAAAIPEGAQAGITLAISMAGSLCLWTGVGKLLERVGVTEILSCLIGPVLHRLFPGTRTNPALGAAVSGNICANFLGLGNAATPMGIQAVQEMAKTAPSDIATDEMCRFIVLNTASVQLIPATVAAVRASLGCATPFDILPAVWITSLCSAGSGLGCAWLLGKVRSHD